MEDRSCSIKFIEEVKKRPIFYNDKLPEYSQRVLKKKYWKEVANISNMSVTECKLKWKNLRAVFVRHLKAQSGPRAKLKKPYYLAKAMWFTLPYIKVNVRALTHMPELPPEDQNDFCDQVLDPQIESEERDSVQLTANKPSIIRHRDPEQSPVEHLHTAKKFKGNCIGINETKKMFLLSLLPELEEMSEQQMRTFKRQVLHLIDDIMKDDSPLPGPSPAPTAS